MRVKLPSLHRLIVLLGVVASLTACNYPAGTPTSPPRAATPTILSPLITVIAKQPDGATPSLPTAQLPPTVVLPTYTPAPSPTAALPALDRKEINSIIRWVQAALKSKDAKVFEQLAAEKLSYTNYIEGGQPVERAKLLSDLNARLPGSSPVCAGASLYNTTLQIWTSGWTPDWQIDQLCYTGCNTLTPPYKSSKAAFFFEPNAGGEYELSSVWLSDDSIFRSIYQVVINSCSTSLTPPTPAALSCADAPPARLEKNHYAYASSASTTSSNMRSAAGTGASIVGLLQPGKAVQVIDGPQCADGYLWWKVRLLSGTLSGWTAEGKGSAYWLVPCAGTEPCAAP